MTEVQTQLGVDIAPVGARQSSRGRQIARWAGAAATVLCLLLAASLLLPAALGFQRYVIVSGSMTGTYDRGSIVYDEEVPVEDLKVGDSITYAPPPGASPEELVTHRIVWIGQNKGGEEIFRTKGDANESADPWTFALDKSEQARVAFSIPYVGYLLAGLSIPIVRMLAIGIPAIVVAFLILGGIWRDAGEEARRRREEANPIHTPQWTE